MKTGIKVSDRIGNYRSTPEQRSEILRLLEQGELTHFRIADLVGVLESTVANMAYKRRKQQQALGN